MSNECSRGERHAPFGVPAAERLPIGLPGQFLQAILAYGLEETVRPPWRREQALRYERVEHLERGVGDGLGSLDRAPAREHGETDERALLARAGEPHAPLDGRSQRPLARWRVARPRRAHHVAEPFQQLRRREEADPSGGELDRERQAVEPRAQRLDGALVVAAQPEGRVTGRGVRREQLARAR